MKKNALKAIASVVVAEFAAYLAVIIAAEAILTFIPVVGNLGGVVIAANCNFAMVYSRIAVYQNDDIGVQGK